MRCSSARLCSRHVAMPAQLYVMVIFRDTAVILHTLNWDPSTVLVLVLLLCDIKWQQQKQSLRSLGYNYRKTRKEKDNYWRPIRNMWKEGARSEAHMKVSPWHLFSLSFFKNKKLKLAALAEPVLTSWKFKKSRITYFCHQRNPPQNAKPTQTLTQGGKAKTGRRPSAGWMLTWLGPQKGVAGHQPSGSGRRVAEARRGTRCAFASGTLALRWRRSLARGTGRMRSSQPWGPGHGPARRRWAPDPVFGFPRWAAPRCRKGHRSRGGHSPWIRPRRAWSTESSTLCLARPAGHLSLPSCQQHRRPSWTWCTGKAIPNRLRNPALSRTSRPAAASSPPCTARFSRLWTPEPGCPRALSRRRSQHGRRRFLCTVWSGSAFPPRNLKCPPLHWTGLQGDHTGNTYRVQGQKHLYRALFRAQPPLSARRGGPTPHTRARSHRDPLGCEASARPAVKCASPPGSASRLPPAPTEALLLAASWAPLIYFPFWFWV